MNILFSGDKKNNAFFGIFEKCRGAEPPVELFLEDVTKKQIVVFLILAPHKLEEKKSDRQQIGVSNSLDFYVANVLRVQKQTRTGSNFYRFIVTGTGIE